MAAMKTTAAGAIVAGIVAWTTLAQAGPTDTPLPTFSDGKPAVAVYTVAGVIKHSNLETDFACTNAGSGPVDIGLEVFGETGALRNSVHTGSGAALNVGVGQTVPIGTGATAWSPERDAQRPRPPRLEVGRGRGHDEGGLRKPGLHHELPPVHLRRAGRHAELETERGRAGRWLVRGEALLEGERHGLQ